MPINFNWSMLILVIGALVGLVGVLFVKDKKPRKVMGWIGAVVFVLALLPAIGVLDYGIAGLNNPVNFGSTLAVSDNTGANAGAGNVVVQGGVQTYAPTATYATVDLKAQSTSVTGTSYYSINNGVFGTSSITAPAIGSLVTYWVDNSSAAAGQYWVSPLTMTVTNSNPDFKNQAYKNGTGSVNLFDVPQNQVIAPATHNVTLSANGQATVRLTYTPTNKQSAIPFGGDFVVEYNNSIASVSCNSVGIATGSPFHTTYGVNSTNNKYTIFHVLGVQDGNAFDDGTGVIKTIDCQFQNGANAPGTGQYYYFKFIPANYYLSQSNGIQLDTEKYADGSSTRVGSQTNLISNTAYWA